MSVLTCESVRIRYGGPHDGLTAVDGVSFVIREGRTLGLVGESGCGKSSLARAIVGLLPIVAGRMLLDGGDVTAARARQSPQYRRKVQMVFQDPTGSLNPRMTVRALLYEALRVARKRSNDDCLRASGRLLDRVGLPAGAFDRFPHEFSGGQRQRLALARALAVEPQVLVTDELTSALDVSVQATILNLVRELQEELGLSLLFISHDLATVRYMSDDVAVMYLGQLVEVAAVDELFSRPRHPYTRALINAIPTLARREAVPALAGEVPDPRRPPPGCRFHTRCPIGPRVNPSRLICKEDDPSPLLRTGVACHFPLNSGAGDAALDTSMTLEKQP